MVRLLLVVCVGWSVASGGAVAQPPAPPRYSPSFSPYVNLARQGATPTLNYYGLVRPQIEARQVNQNLQAQVQQNSQALAGNSGFGNTPQGGGGVNPTLAPTGSPVGYLTHLGYFLNSGSGIGRPGQSGLGGGRGVVAAGSSLQPSGATGGFGTLSARPPSPGVRR